MSILILILSIFLLLFLIIYLKINAFLALVLVTLFVGIGEGMELTKLLKSMQKGMGDTLGSLAMVIGFGVMLGKMLSESGAVQQISSSLINFFGRKNIKLSMVMTGFVVGIAMYYNAGFMVLLPLIFSVASQTGLPLVYVGIATASSLSVTHGFLPPHPGPSAIAILFSANVGKVLIYGVIVAIPTIALAGLVLPDFLKKMKTDLPQGFFENKPIDAKDLPSFGMSLFVALIPILLMALATAVELLTLQQNTVTQLIHFIGEPSISLLIALLTAIFSLRKNRTLKSIMDKLADSVGSIAMILLIIGAGGAFKQVLIDSEMGKVIADSLKNLPVSPLLLGWLIATFTRVALGSATVAGLTAAGIVQPLLASMHVSSELMVLAIGAGSLMFSHVNDTGFWMFKEYFGLTISQTFRSWSVMETLIGTVGLIGVLLLELIVK